MDLYLALFLFSTLWIGPFWFAMLLHPNAPKTHKLMEGPWFFAGPLLLWFLILIFDTQGFSNIGASYQANNDALQALAMSFSSKSGFTATWAHVVVGDIFVTRWIWTKSLEVPMAPWKMRMSIFFGVMLMPLGLLLHALFTNKKK